ncbi:hypothetical protein [Chitinophaga sp. MM2321]|uniref:hypothetical protein n=1 Tax=Chitinophaga sp. MM2321 TaxID=3137178 RepID=UPI0032D59B70
MFKTMIKSYSIKKISPILVIVFLYTGIANGQAILHDPPAKENIQLDKMVGQPVDIAPWAYSWRADQAVQDKPEAYFIPRRLGRMDKIYRTAFYQLPEAELKSIYYKMPDLLKPLPPQPKSPLQAGLLWRGTLSKYQVQLNWPADRDIPSPDAVEVRVYPTSYGWFGWTVDKILDHPQVSADKRTWTYNVDSTAKMDWAFSLQVNAATEMVAVFYEDKTTTVVPNIQLVSPQVGVWKRMDLEIEWGFQQGIAQTDFDGVIESDMAIAGTASPLLNDKGTTITGDHAWQSRYVNATRRGITLPILYASGEYPALDSRITIRTGKGGFSFRPGDLENGPILIPEQGIFITAAGSGKTARQFAESLAGKQLKNSRQLTLDHREAASWEELMQNVRLSTCPVGTVIPSLPVVPEPPMQVQLPDSNWTNAWRAASFQLTGPHMWGGLAFEVGRVAHQMDLVGLHKEADRVYTHFLRSPGVKADGDYVDANGALEWATSMRHDMGYSHDGTHASTGRLLFAMADHYFLTNNKEWFRTNKVRMQAAADWIIRQRTLYLSDIPKREELLMAGLMPPSMVGDYALPASDWHWYYANDAMALQGLQRFADALVKFDSEEGNNYRDEALQYNQDIRKAVEKQAANYLDQANSYRADIRRAVKQEAILSPVRRLGNGTYGSFIPLAAYTRGEMLSVDLKAPQRSLEDVIMGSLPLAEPFSALDAKESSMVNTLDVMDEAIVYNEGSPAADQNRKAKGAITKDAWFWNTYSGLPKASHNANIYLLQDDVPNFLRFWMNAYAAIVAADGRFWEWGHLGDFANCTSPDNGTAGWFMENFRNLLIMEDNQSLWIARATPRAWLEQGKKISVKNAPTYFGTMAYEIESNVKKRQINATIEIPGAHPPKSVLLRFRHPKAAHIKSVLVNGKPWTAFNKEKELIEITGLSGKVTVTANY